MKRVIALILAGSIATVGLASAPAKADDTGKILGLLLGAAIIGTVISNEQQAHAQNGEWHQHNDGVYHRHPNPKIDRYHPQPVYNLSLPQRCKQRIILKGKRVDAYKVNCLKRYGYKINNKGVVTHPNKRYAQAKPILVRL